MTARFTRQRATQLHVAAETRKTMRAGDHEYMATEKDRWRTADNLSFDDVPVAQPYQRVNAIGNTGCQINLPTLQPAIQVAEIPVYERDVLAAVLEALRLHPRVAWCERMNSGKFKLPGKDGREQWVRFGFKGMADVTGQLVTGQRLEVECKRPGEVATADQAAFLARVIAAGGVGFVAHGIDDVWRELGA